jgi:hypothetical protein
MMTLERLLAAVAKALAVNAPVRIKATVEVEIGGDVQLSRMGAGATVRAEPEEETP